MHGHNSHIYGVTPTYKSWVSMKGRCLNPNNPDYFRYGGRGIKVCERWMGFINFLADMGERPEGTTLERKNGDGNYEPGNVKWGTLEEQNLNRKSTKWLTLNGETKTLTQWAKDAGIWKGTLSARLKKGMPLEKALNIPIGTKVYAQT